MKSRLPANLKHLVKRRAPPEARALVLSLMRKSGKPLTSQELYEVTVKHQTENLKQEGASSGPEADSLIPSMRYLKKTVLVDLQSSGKIQKVHTKEEVSEEEIEKFRTNNPKAAKKMPSQTALWQWRWQLAVPVSPSAPEEEKKLFGVEVGVGEDWSHLNRRRQRARQEKITNDVAWLKELEQARREGAGKAS